MLTFAAAAAQQVPSDIVAQMRYVNESINAKGKKASKEKDLKKILERKSQSMKNLSVSDVMVQWVTDSKANPPVLAVTSVIQARGEVLSQVKITEATTVADILKVRGRRGRKEGRAVLLGWPCHGRLQPG